MAEILVIDDDTDILDYIRTALQDLHTVTTANDGERGLFECERRSFDLIITDIFMPFRDGLDILREVKNSYPDIKTIAMTGYATKGNADYLKAAEAMGANATLPKPFTVEQLFVVVDSVLAP